MKILIAGAGVIGSNLAESLTQEDHEVYLIESNEDIAKKVDEKLDVKVIQGNAADPDTLRRLEAGKADLVIAVTNSDETNLIVCFLTALLGAKRRIARVRSKSLGKTLAEFGYDRFYINEIINPEEVVAQNIVKTIQTPGTREVADFADGRILLRAFEIPKYSSLCGTLVGDLRDEDFPWPFLIISIVRDGVVIIPKGDTSLQAEDRIYVLLPAPSLGEFLTFVDPEIRMPRKVVVYGATEMGLRVAQEIQPRLKETVLLEENEDRARAVAGDLEGVRVINGSAAERDILTECGIEAADAFIATSTNDHSNLVSAVLAKKMGAKIAVIITQEPDYMSIADTLDIDAIINPRLLAVQQILRLVRGKSVQSVMKLVDCDAEAVEFISEAGSAVTKAPIKDLAFPKNAIIGAVCRGKEVILAKGDTQILPDERVIVFCRESAVKRLQDLFTRKKLF